MNEFSCDSKCVKSAIDIIGDKWSPLLVLALCSGACKFSQVEKSLKGISPRTLAQRLEMLQRQGIITKTAYQQAPVRYQYSLTPKGLSLQAILKTMESWGSEYGNATTSQKFR